MTAYIELTEEEFQTYWRQLLDFRSQAKEKNTDPYVFGCALKSAEEFLKSKKNEIEFASVEHINVCFEQIEDFFKDQTIEDDYLKQNIKQIKINNSILKRIQMSTGPASINSFRKLYFVKTKPSPRNRA